MSGIAIHLQMFVKWAVGTTVSVHDKTICEPLIAIANKSYHALTVLATLPVHLE